VSARPESPYKGLAAFEDSELDALLFFGREREIEAVASNVLASRLTVLYGPSGVGKSSLLRAGVARRLRELSGAAVVVHDTWAEDPAAGLIASVSAECEGLGPTAGLVDTVAAAAQEAGEVYLLLDQFEEYVLYHGFAGPLSSALPELLRRPGLRVNVLLAIRDDALSELDEFTGRIPELFANLFRLDRLGRDEGRAAILGPLKRYSELTGETYTAEDALVEAVLDEASTEAGVVEAPYLQLVLERLWEREREGGSRELRLSTLRAIGGTRAVVREHVHGALERLTLPEQEVAARLVRQLVTPSGRKLSHEADDLAEYAEVEPAQLRQLLEELGRRRIVRGVDGTPGAPTRYEIFHDVLGPPLLAWQHERQLRDERERAARQRRRLLAIVGATVVALIVVGAVAAYALIQRSDARQQAQRALGRELAARALANLATNPQSSLRLALRAAQLAPAGSTSVLRSSLLAMREQRVFDLGGTIVSATYAPNGDDLLMASSNGRLTVYRGDNGRLVHLKSDGPLTTAVWITGGVFATGSAGGVVNVWGGPGEKIHTGSPITALGYGGRTLLVASGADIRLVTFGTGKTRLLAFAAPVEAAAIDGDGKTVAVALRNGRNTTAELIDARTGQTIRQLPETGIRSFAFSPDGKLLASGSYDTTARIWDARTGELLHVLPHKGYVYAEHFSPDGKSLVTSSADGAAYVWNVATGQRELLLVDATGAITDATFSPDGNELATASADRVARLYNASNGRLLASLAGADNAVTSVSFDASGRTLASGSKDGTVRVWDALPAGTLTTIDTRKTPVESLWLGNNAVSVAGSEARILTPSGHVVETLAMKAPIVASAAAGTTLALVDRAGEVLTDQNGTLTTETRPHATAVAVTRAGAILLARANGDVERLGGPRLAHVHSPVLGLATGDDRFLVRTADEVRVYTDAGTPVSTIHAATDHAKLSPDGLQVATATGNVAELWDAATGQRLHTLRGHTSAITDLAYSPGGLNLTTVSVDHTGLIWSTRTGRLLSRLIGHFLPINSVAYSPGGNWIVTSSHRAGLWNARTGRLMFYVGSATEPLTSAAFSPKGEWILTGSSDGTARVYDCQVCAPRERLEQLAAHRLARLSGK
jgi:WD40 repeat protein